MRYVKQDKRVCSFYVTSRLIDILEYEDTNKKKLLKLLNEFKDEMIHNLGIDALHNHYGDI
jgi:hypothetical protein